MKSILFALFLFISNSILSQTWVSDFTVSYKEINGEWIKTHSEFDDNTFVVCGTSLVWVSDRIVQYSIAEINDSNEDRVYFLRGRDEIPLSYSVRANDATLMFKGDDGGLYAVYFRFANQYKKY